jgi:hypothetical protein
MECSIFVGFAIGGKVLKNILLRRCFGSGDWSNGISVEYGMFPFTYGKEVVAEMIETDGFTLWFLGQCDVFSQMRQYIRQGDVGLHLPEHGVAGITNNDFAAICGYIASGGKSPRQKTNQLQGCWLVGLRGSRGSINA